MKLEVKNLSKNFGEKEVLKNLNFSCVSGQCVALLGKNGAGKTTFFRCLLNIYQEDSGEFLVDGKKLKESNLKIGYLPEERGLYINRKVYDQMLYFAKLKGLNKEKADQMIDYLLEKLDIVQYKNIVLDKLSKGNKQKVQLAVAVLDNPDIIIFDEPFSGLDPVSSLSLRNLILDFVKMNKIVIFSSHEMGYVEEFCKDVAILNDGRIDTFGKINDIKSSYDVHKVKVIFAQEEIIPKVIANETLNIICSEIYQEEEDVIFVLKDINSLESFQKSLLDHEYFYTKFELLRPTLEEVFVMKVGEI